MCNYTIRPILINDINVNDNKINIYKSNLTEKEIKEDFSTIKGFNNRASLINEILIFHKIIH